METDGRPPGRLDDVFRAVASRAGYSGDALACAYVAGAIGARTDLVVRRLGAAPVPRDQAESDALCAQYGLPDQLLWWLVREVPEPRTHWCQASGAAPEPGTPPAGR